MAIQDQYFCQNFTGLSYNQNWLTRIYPPLKGLFKLDGARHGLSLTD